MKNTQELPKKWYVKAHPSYNAELIAYRGGEFMGSWQTAALCSDKMWRHSSYVSEYTEITIDQFREFVNPKSSTVKAKSFEITGSPELLEAMGKRLRDIGYNVIPCSNIVDWERISHNNVGQGIFKSKTHFKELYVRCSPDASDVSFVLPQDYDKALKFAEEQLQDSLWNITPIKVGDWVVGWHAPFENLDCKPWQVGSITGTVVSPKGKTTYSTEMRRLRLATAEEIKEATEIKLPFGSLIFTIDRQNNLASCSFGTIKRTEIKEVMSWLSKGPALLGYDSYADNKSIIHFGCQSGTVEEIFAIYNAF